MSFADLGLGSDLLRAIEDAGYKTPTPIQAQAIPQILMCRDVLGLAQTGTGKTASFTLPMIEVLSKGRARARMPRSLILTPTRELAAQIADNFDTYGKYHNLTKALLVGGVSMDEQIKKLDRGVDVLIATPGRLLDLFGRGNILLPDIKILVIDEADRMLDMGFIPDLDKIVTLLPPLRQTLFFSATMPPEIKRLADKFLSNPKQITVSRLSSPAEMVEQALIEVKGRDKTRDLANLVKNKGINNALVFCNRKRDIAGVVQTLTRMGCRAASLHGDMVQSQRTKTLDEFKQGNIDFLVCSDVAARGIDIAELPFVINYDVPINAEDYIHRIGRTGRAGREGHAYTFVGPEDVKFVAAIEKLIKREIPRVNVSSQSRPPQKPENKPAPVDRIEKQAEKVPGDSPQKTDDAFDGEVPAFLLRKDK